MLLYVILSGCSPFSADEEEAILQLVNEGKYEFHESEWSDVSDSAKDLISKLLVVDPTQRLNMEGMLEHEWLKEAVANGRALVAQATESRKAAKAAQQQQQQTNGANINYKEAEVVVEGSGGKKGEDEHTCTASHRLGVLSASGVAAL